MPAYKIGLMGKPNSGKSYSRMTVDYKSSFVIMPDLSDPYLMKNETERVDQFNFLFADKSYLKTIATILNVKYDEDDENNSINAVIEAIISKKDSLVDNYKGDAKSKEKIAKIFASISKFCTGNYSICPDLANLKNWLKFVSKYMPHIKHIFLPDFTHYLTNVVASEEFAQKGNYSRYTDLATETVKTFLTKTINELRSDLVVVIEFHVKIDKNTDEKRIFIPSGQMLESTFIPESYFETLLYCFQDYDEKDETKRYKFQTRATEDNPYIRNAGLLPDKIMVNNLNIVIEAYKKANSNKFNENSKITEENAAV